MSRPADGVYLVSAESVVALDRYFVVAAAGSLEQWEILALMALLREREFRALHPVVGGEPVAYRPRSWQPHPLTAMGLQWLSGSAPSVPYDLFGVKPRILRAVGRRARALTTPALALMLRLNDDLVRTGRMVELARRHESACSLVALAYVIRRLRLDGAVDEGEEPLRTWLRLASRFAGEPRDTPMWEWRVIAGAEEAHTSLAVAGRRQLEPGLRRQQRRAAEHNSAGRRPTVRASDVPAVLRPLVAWARRLGIGDDPAWGAAVGRLSPGRRRLLIANYQPLQAAVDEWLAQEEARATPLAGAAAVYFWLREAMEEVLADC